LCHLAKKLLAMHPSRLFALYLRISFLHFLHVRLVADSQLVSFLCLHAGLKAPADICLLPCFSPDFSDSVYSEGVQ
jgi:hypothetical protein